MSSPKRSGPAADPSVKVIAKHRRAKFDYAVEETLEAGLELRGSEVKGLRCGTATLSDSYAIPKDNQLFLLNAHIGTYNPASVFSHEPTRSRRLLVHRAEIDELAKRDKDKRAGKSDGGAR